MFKTKKEFQRLKTLKYGLLRRNWSKYSDETNNKYLQKKAKEFDVKVPKNIKAFEKYAKRIANKIEERQYLYTPENQEVLDKINKIKEEIESNTDYNQKVSKHKIKGDINIEMFKQLFNHRFKGVKGNITFEDIIKAEKTFKNIKRSPQDIINKTLKGKLEFTDLDNYRKVLHNIGIDDKTYNKLRSEYTKANIFQVSKLEPFLRNLEAREEYYLPDSDYYDGDELDGLRSKFLSNFSKYITKPNREKEES